MEEALAECRAALHGATATMLHAHAPNTVKRRQQHAAKAEAFFASLPKELGVSLKTAGPEHVLWFVRQHWLPRHTGELCMCLVQPLSYTARTYIGPCQQCITARHVAIGCVP